jgi:hypothetical protein
MSNALGDHPKTKRRERREQFSSRPYARVHACGCARTRENCSRSSRLRSIDVRNACRSWLSYRAQCSKDDDFASSRREQLAPGQIAGHAINEMGNLPTTLLAVFSWVDRTRGQFAHVLLSAWGISPHVRINVVPKLGTALAVNVGANLAPALWVLPRREVMRAPKARQNASRGLSKTRLTRLTRLTARLTKRRDALALRVPNQVRAGAFQEKSRLFAAGDLRGMRGARHGE